MASAKVICRLECRRLHMKKTKKDPVTKALKRFIARREQGRLLDLFGKIDWDPGYDYKKERSRR